MTDMTAFERRIADGMLHRAGPIRPVDDLAIYEAVTAASRSHGWGFTMFSALRFVAASVIVALFGGFLLAGILTTQDDNEMGPAAASIAAPDGSAQPSVPGTGSITLDAGDLVGMEGLELFVKVFGRTSPVVHVPIEGGVAVSGQMSVEPGEQFVWLLAGTPPCRDTGYFPACGGDTYRPPDYFCKLDFDVQPGEDIRIGLSGLPRYDAEAESQLACPVVSWKRSTELAGPTTE